MTTNQLTRYDQFTAALAEAASVDEVKAIHDKATALKAAAKILNDREAVANLAVIRAKAERRLGEFMEAGKADRAGRGKPKNISGKCLRLPTLRELGIGDNLAHRSRRAAAMSQEAFDDLIAEQHKEICEGIAGQIYYPQCEAEVAEKKAERKRARAEGKKRRAENKAKTERERPEREARFAEHQAWVAAQADEPDDDIVEVLTAAPASAPAPAGPLSAKALGEFKYACRNWLTKLSPEDFAAAIAYAQSFAPAVVAA
jgi:hypothetical protein